MVSATTRPSVPLRSPLLERRFRSARGYGALDPRPRASPRFAIFTRNADTRFSGSGSRPTTSATTLPTYGHTLEHPILADPRSRLTQSSRMCPRSRRSFLRSGDLPLSKKDHEDGEPRQILPRPIPRRCKLAVSHDPGNHRPITTPLAGDALARSPLAAMTVGRWRWTARAGWLRAKDFPSRRLLPQYDVGESSPPHVSHPSSPSWLVVDSSSGGLDCPFVLMSRPRPSFRRRPAKGNAFPKAGEPSTTRNPRRMDHSTRTGTGIIHDAAAPLSRGRHCNRRYQRLCCPASRA
jgi:hypothetical protein